MVHHNDQKHFHCPRLAVVRVMSELIGHSSSGWRWVSLKEGSVVVKALAGLLEEATSTFSWREANPCKVLPLEGASGQLSAVHLGLATLDWEHASTAWKGAPPPSKPP